MKRDQKLEDALALIIACTHRLNRPKDMVTLAKSISYASECLGGLRELASKVGVSVQQLKDFLAVESLSDDVKELVASRGIDSVDVVKTIRGLTHNKQMVLANQLVGGRITSKDVRSIVGFAKRFSQKTMAKVINDYRKSKDVRIYVVQFRAPKEFHDDGELLKRFEELVGKREIKTLLLKDSRGVLEISDVGLKNLRKAVRDEKTTLRKFIESVVGEMAGRK